MSTLELAVSEEQTARFDIDGFINYGRIADASELAEVSAEVDDICDGAIALPDGGVRFHAGLKWGEGTGVTRREAVWQILGAEKRDGADAAIARLCRKALIQNIIEALLDRPVKLWGSQIILKPGHHGGAVPWHQDTSYWGQEKRLTCWLAIDDATPFNGCMRMIPGSHRKGQLKFTSTKIDGAPCALLQTDSVSEDTQVYVPVRAGCASFHHPLTLHASDRNATPNRRRAIAITFQALS
jgi:ectoine hydroxylase-related dioxygenase (phytanoyl-CoA dioxygenase family)